MVIKVAKIQGLLLFPIVPPSLLIMICECFFVKDDVLCSVAMQLHTVSFFQCMYLMMGLACMEY